MTEILALVDLGMLDEARAALLERVATRQDQPGGHAEEARLAERLGLSTAAIRAWQLALRDDPADRAAWGALYELYTERGEPERAASCRASLARLGVSLDERPPNEAPLDEALPGPNDADLVRFVHLFAGREDVHARMWRDAKRGVGYSPIEGGLSPELARAHLEGRVTLGVYPVRHDDTVSFFVLDLDATRPAMEAAQGDAVKTRALRALIAEEGRRLLRALRELGLRPIFEDSGQKGRHLWCFLPTSTPAEEVCAFGRAALASLWPRDTSLHLEFFPKQARVAEGGVGNLIKLPLGLHLGSGRRSLLLDDQGEPLADPHAALRAVVRVPLSALTALPEPLPTPVLPAEPPRPTLSASGERPWSEADFDAHPQVAAVLSACPVLREVVRGALAERALSRDAAVVLEHTLGHLPAGVRACNYLFERVPGFPAGTRLGAPHRGSPTSCAKIRARLPDLAQRCACTFPDAPGQYPHPLRHLDAAAPAPPPAPSLDELLLAYARALDRARQVAEEELRLRRAAVAALGRIPGGRWSVQGGEWRLEGSAELPELCWVPTPNPSAG